ncbi:MAG: ABC transporter permease [Spirochaetaceae bacterium]|nr:ABC transporter permease [Spirochaetaceae bacterium]
MNILLAMYGAVSQGVLWGIMCLGLYITYKVLDFADLTVDGSFALGGAVNAALIVLDCNPLVALFISFIAGGISGIVTGLLNTKLKIPGILAGILTMIALYSINIRIMGRANISLLGETTLMTQISSLINTSTTTTSFIIGTIFSVIIIFAMYWFFGTEIGSAIRATGNNEKMVRAQGVNTDNMKILGLMLGNALVSLSGGLVAQSQGYGDVQMGTGTIVIGLASIIIGEVIFGKRFSFWYILMSVVMGSIIYRVIIAIVLQLGLTSSDLKLFTAVTVALALSIPVMKSKFANKKKN